MATRKRSKKTTRKTGSRARSPGARRYGKKASEKVEGAMQEMKEGELTSGRSRKKVKSRKQAIAIGLSEARRAGGKVPARKRTSKRSGRKRGSRRASRAE